MYQNDDPIQALLEKYVNQGQETPNQTPPAPTGFAVISNGQVIHVASQEEALKLQALEHQRYISAIQETQGRLQQATTPQPESVTPDLGKPTGNDYDAQKFVAEFVTDPRKMLLGTLKELPEFKQREQEVEQLKTQLAVRDFAAAHPLYGVPNVLQGLHKMTIDHKLEPTAQNYELMAFKAQQMGMLPNEQALREQQQRLFAENVARQQEQLAQVPQEAPNNVPQYNPSYNPGAPLSNQNPQLAAGYMNNRGDVQAPPVAPRTGYQGSPNTIAQAEQAVNNGKLRGPQLGEFLKTLESQGYH